MNLFGKSSTLSEDPEIRQVEKSIAQEAREDQKNLERNIKDLSGAEKSHNKSIKVCKIPSGTPTPPLPSGCAYAHRSLRCLLQATNKAQQAVDKAVETEYEATKALNRAAHDRDAAIANEATAEKTVKVRHARSARRRAHPSVATPLLTHRHRYRSSRSTKRGSNRTWRRGARTSTSSSSARRRTTCVLHILTTPASCRGPPSCVLKAACALI